MVTDNILLNNTNHDAGRKIILLFLPDEKI